MFAQSIYKDGNSNNDCIMAGRSEAYGYFSGCFKPVTFCSFLFTYPPPPPLPTLMDKVYFRFGWNGLPHLPHLLPKMETSGGQRGVQIWLVYSCLAILNPRPGVPSYTFVFVFLSVFCGWD